MPFLLFKCQFKCFLVLNFVKNITIQTEYVFLFYKLSIFSVW